MQYFISGGWTNGIAYGVLLAVLMFRPEGMVGTALSIHLSHYELALKRPATQWVKPG